MYYVYLLKLDRKGGKDFYIGYTSDLKKRIREHNNGDTRSTKNRNPKLSKKGQLRALNWAYFFREIPLVAIYSTNYIRTITTAEPVAGDKNLPIIIYSPKEVDINSFKKKNHGKSVLIVGHSNTTPEFVNAILGFEKFKKNERQ